MADRVDPTVHSVQPAESRAAPDRVIRQPRLAQLPNRDHAMLSARDRGDLCVGWGAFLGHIPHKAPRDADSPPVTMMDRGIKGRSDAILASASRLGPGVFFCNDCPHGRGEAWLAEMSVSR